MFGAAEPGQLIASLTTARRQASGSVDHPSPAAGLAFGTAALALGFGKWLPRGMFPVFPARGGGMRAFVSDQGSSGSLVIGTGLDDFTVVAALELPPGSWVVFATVALASTGATGTAVVQIAFLLDGKIYSTAVQSDFGGFLVVPLTTGLALDRRQTVQVGCVATEPDTVSSQPTTITAIQVESVTRIRDWFPGGS
jgi:hypothetical protein